MIEEVEEDEIEVRMRCAGRAGDPVLAYHVNPSVDRSSWLYEPVEGPMKNHHSPENMTIWKA